MVGIDAGRRIHLSVLGMRAGMAAGFSSTMRYDGGIAGIAVLGRLLHLTGGRRDDRLGRFARHTRR